jgi:hypothetical protein
MLDLDIVVPPRHAEAGSRFERIPGGVIKFPDQRLEIYRHAIPSLL